MMKLIYLSSLATLIYLVPKSQGFGNSGIIQRNAHASTLKHVPNQRGLNFVKAPLPSQPSAIITRASKNGDNAKLNDDISSRLLAETIAPWRSLRLFLYFSCGSGAFVGGLITISRILAASRPGNQVDVSPDYMNLLIDFGAALAFAILGKIDSDKGAELATRVEQKLERKKENQKLAKGMKEREKKLRRLELNVRISDDGNIQRAPVEAIQSGGKQHMIIVAGSQKAIRDALLGANLLKMEFAMRDVLVVPYELDKRKEEDLIRPDGTGFGGAAAKPTWETQPYVAWTVGEGWENWINAELDDAIKQNGEKAVSDGIAIVVSNNGNIIRRGLGKVPWREMVEELEKTVKEDSLPDLGFLSGN